MRQRSNGRCGRCGTTLERTDRLLDFQRRARLGHLPLEIAQHDGDARELLTQVIVEISRDARTLLFLRMDQPASEILILLIRLTECRRTLADRHLRTASPGVLDNQAPNQCALKHEERAGPQDVPLVRIPRRRLPKLDDAPRRQACLVDAVAPQLTPIEGIYVRINLMYRNAVRRLTFKHAQCDVGHRTSQYLIPQKASTDCAVAQVYIEPAIDRSVRDRRKLTEGICPVELVAVRVFLQRQVVDDGPLRNA